MLPSGEDGIWRQRCRTHVQFHAQPSENSPCCMPSVSGSRTFFPSNRNPIPPHPHHGNPEPTQWTGLFWTFPINGMIYYVTFCFLLLSLSIMFSRFIRIVACVRASFCFMAEYGRIPDGSVVKNLPEMQELQEIPV